MKTPYTLIRSDRRTLALEVRRDLTLVVRAPRRCPQGEIDRFFAAHASFVEKALIRQRERALKRPEPDDAEQRALMDRARKELPLKVEHYVAIMGLFPTGITITGAITRFGSCSPKNRICFSWRLMTYPDEAIDYVVVHELAHIAHKNHSKEFYALISSVLPDYKERQRLLRE